MTDSDVRHSAAGGSGNVAGTHAEVDDTVRPIAPLLSDNTNPAGGIMSGAKDMAKWMMVQLDSGRVADGSRLFTPATTRQLWREVTPMPIGDPPAGSPHLRPHFNGYALGLDVQDYRGKLLLTHTGGLPGYLSRVAMLPELRLGVAVLTNQESGAAFNAIAYRVLDHYLGAKAPDYPGIYSADPQEEQGEAAERWAEGRDQPRLDLGPVAAARRIRRHLPRRLVRRRGHRGGGRQAGDPVHADAGAGGRPGALAARQLPGALA